MTLPTLTIPTPDGHGILLRSWIDYWIDPRTCNLVTRIGVGPLWQNVREVMRARGEDPDAEGSPVRMESLRKDRPREDAAWRREAAKFTGTRETD
jgi:hypothetical protein